MGEQMKILGLILVLLSLNARADLQDDIRRLRNLANTGTNGGSSDVISYNVKTFEYATEVAKMMEIVRESDCKYRPVIGKFAFVNNISSFEIFDSKEAQVLLRRLLKDKKIKAVIGYYWSMDGGDSEYCSTESLYIYFINGEALMSSYDSTT
jgi:hypothetical protein